ncbi:hypothetical protein [Sulfitobacter brevis]|uniref:hypothetical protein n=1 Tax=Sulfitobacter brevis TaxID=74348 RepID=UPI00116062DB|nr:hypothetical protein [Sulfitobacter brevis]
MVVFLTIDVFFVGIYAVAGVLKAFDLAPEIASLQLNAETGLASIWNYGKFMAAIAALVMIRRREGGVSLLILTLLFLLLLLDDYYEVHDHLARVVGERISFGPLSSLHPINRGELFVYTVLLVIAAPSLWFALKNVQPPSRAFVGAMVIGVFLIGLFGVGVDVLHGVLDAMLSGYSDLVGKIFNRLMTIVEDGGEMVAISLCTWLSIVRLWEGRGA